ncbi:MAG TPA: DUF5715 family protein [Longimicrobiales bacterium]|nr:DUF5715 family protein [Longimicrobiales bacterium]
MKLRAVLILVLASSAILPRGISASEGSLRGSRASMQRQNRIARANDYSFLRTTRQVNEFVRAGRLVELPGNPDYQLDGPSLPYGRPEVKLFVEQLAAEYHTSCGEPLVVTSLTRPLSRQPRNAHALSVHPAGMAVDLRISDAGLCVRWLEETLLQLESEDLLDVTRERRPPHFHVAVFPKSYRAHVERMLAEAAAAEPVPTPSPPATPPLAPAPVTPPSRASLPFAWFGIVGVLAGSATLLGQALRRRRR